eukprot:Skav206948  [mRNA]  locus=scaffold1304:95476:98242:+ [translate_table: standard]
MAVSRRPLSRGGALLVSTSEVFHHGDGWLGMDGLRGSFGGRAIEAERAWSTTWSFVLRRRRRAAADAGEPSESQRDPGPMELKRSSVARHASGPVPYDTVQKKHPNARGPVAGGG